MHKQTPLTDREQAVVTQMKMGYSMRYDRETKTYSLHMGKNKESLPLFLAKAIIDKNVVRGVGGTSFFLNKEFQ